MKNICATIIGFTIMALLFSAISYAMLAKLDEANERVAALEQQNNELKDELHSTTDAIYEEIASLTDAISSTEDDISDISDEVDEIKIKEEEEAEENTNEEKAKTNSVAQPSVATETAEISVKTAETTAESSVSSYLGSYRCTGYVATGNPCANGNYPTTGYTIASNSIPMGTRVYIEGIGERVVEDRGGMDGGTIDVFVGSVDEAYALTGTYDVYIID